MSADNGPTLVFGQNADEYRAFRPQYPDSLFDWLAAIAPARGFAWDCGAGSGQAALGLSRRFDRVLATDPDPRQLARAPKAPNVYYRRAPAEADLGLCGTVDLIACACAIHWFDLDAFYARARRALKPGGGIAVWTYDWPWTGAGPLDSTLARLKDEILGPFWGPNARFYFSGYRELPFPFPERAHPGFETPIAETPTDLLRFLSTWSAVRKYRAQYGLDPLARIEAELEAAWRAHPPATPIRVPLHMRCGYKVVES